MLTYLKSIKNKHVFCKEFNKMTEKVKKISIYIEYIQGLKTKNDVFVKKVLKKWGVLKNK